MRKKLLAVGLAAALCLALTGCSSVKTAPELIEKYTEQNTAANYHTDATMDFGIMLSGEGVSIGLPISMEMSADVLDDKMHATVDVSMNIMGQEMKSTTEAYVDGGTTYSIDSDTGVWAVTDGTEDVVMTAGIAQLDPDAFKAAMLKHDIKTGNYTVTQSFADFAEYSDLYDTLSEMYGEMGSIIDLGGEELLEAWADSKVVYEFDKDFRLLSIDIPSCEFSGTTTEEGMEMTFKATFAMNFTFSAYGEITEDKVMASQEVKDAATLSDKGESAIDDEPVIDDESGIDDESMIDDESEIDDEPMIDDDPAAEIDMSSGEEIDPGFSVDPGQFDESDFLPPDMFEDESETASDEL